MSKKVTTVDDILGGSEGDRLKKIADDNKWLDKDLLMDVYLILKTGSVDFIPDADLLKDLERSDPDYWTHRLDISKRKDFLKNMAESKYMEALINLNDISKAINVFVDHMKKAQNARIEAAKKRGAITDSSGGSVQGYMDEDALDELANAVQSDDFSFDSYMDGLVTYQDVSEDDGVGEFYSGCGFGNYYTASNVGSERNLAKSVVQYGQDLPNSYPVLFEWYTKILDELGVKKLKDEDTVDPSNKKRIDQMEDYDKMSDIDPADVEREDFDARVASKSLDVKQDIKEEEGTCHIIVLLDVSMSMCCADLGGRVCRAFAANVLTLALLNFAYKKGYTVHVVPFEAQVGAHKVQHAIDKNTALDAMRWLGGQEYDGSGTNIEAALLYAYKIVADDPTYKKCDIALITDGCSPLSDRVITEKPKRTKVRTLLCCNDNNHGRYGSHAHRLSDASDSFANITWDNMTNSFSTGNIFQGINDPHSND